jgi:hypothetical protein
METMATMRRRPRQGVEMPRAIRLSLLALVAIMAVLFLETSHIIIAAQCSLRIRALHFVSLSLSSAILFAPYILSSIQGLAN